ncbi:MULTISPECIES: HD domain-containing protein [unclassified Gilliamella]|uniref:HD domain-containing protein n=1 Tax=unclassified Gilliamella TaxID=2685620 RepID=UPI00159EEA70|nr:MULTISPECIES: HD domain-containing protein [Gilliamella]MCX8597742.1 hypothetical protein [Gilliamella sp. B3493]MCX8599889.1 hypothetical protein [Gilliamella sp. B3486]MCX8690193.1 hypothetical protein [Gilliamella sp. B2973]MCX8705878.1 hypothetical protein [Gilliamella sp. B3127]
MCESFYQYWGKCQPVDQSSDYHLLPYHNLDVAACGYHIVKNNDLKLGFITSI